VLISNSACDQSSPRAVCREEKKSKQHGIKKYKQNKEHLEEEEEEEDVN